jgi:hypothetical protein
MIKNQYGITNQVKELLEDLIINYDSKPKRIHIRLNKKKFKKQVDVMPNLKQIQDYLKNRR